MRKKNITQPKKSNPEIKLSINNEVKPDAKEEYVAYCDFTIVEQREDGELYSVQKVKGDIITEKKTPKVWIDQALNQKFLINKSDLEKWDVKTLSKKGYN